MGIISVNRVDRAHMKNINIWGTSRGRAGEQPTIFQADVAADALSTAMSEFSSCSRWKGGGGSEVQISDLVVWIYDSWECMDLRAGGGRSIPRVPS